jgi:hypothetical protein
MKRELAKHLGKVRDTVSEVDRMVSSHRYPSDRRTVMVVGLLSTIIQHHRSILLLIKSGGTFASSCALARDIVKGLRYGLWINFCATEEQISRIETDDEFPFSIPEMIEEIESAYSADPFFESLRNRWGAQLYKYSRSEIFQLGRWNIDSSSGLHLDDREICDMTTIATLSIVVLAAKFFDSQKLSAECKQTETLAADYAAHAS